MRLLGAIVVALLIAASFACADETVFSENFDDGNWTANPAWETVPADPSISISSAQSASAPYSFKLAANNAMGAIRATSGLTSASGSFTCTFNIYIESTAEESIPWVLQDSTGKILTLIFLEPSNKVRLTYWTSSQTWSGTYSSTLPSYGAWHQFKVTYNGTKTSLFIDGHTTADATVNGVYFAAPTKLVMGNFLYPHTGTFYVDDLNITTQPTPPPPTPGRVYVQFCSDTSTDGIDCYVHDMNFPPLDFSYTSPVGQAGVVFSDSWRNSKLDSLGNPIKITWYMQCGSIYDYGVSTGPIYPYELMMDYHGADIARWDDEMAYHYHTWAWTDPDRDGVYHWNQTPSFTDCQTDFEVTIARLMVDRAFFPSSFRSGWHFMDNAWSNWFEDWMPYGFQDDAPRKWVNTAEPVAVNSDWSRATTNWIAYHPSATDYQVPGSMKRWEVRCLYTPGTAELTSAMDTAFATALGGSPQIICLYSHLKETNYPDAIAAAHNLLVAAHAKYPTVDFEYLTARSSMLKWRGGTDVTPPTLGVSYSDSGGVRTALITSSEPIFQKQPFVARRATDGTYSRVNCTSAGTNQWTVSYNPATTAKLAVAVTDLFGNPALKYLPLPLTITNPRTSATSTTAEVIWETSVATGTDLVCRGLSGGATFEVHNPNPVARHQATLTGLLPGRIYVIDLAADDTEGGHAALDGITVLTESLDPVAIDNQDTRFSLTGSWSTASTSYDRYAADYRYCTATPSGTSRANWNWTVTQTGAYNVYAWWPMGTNRSTAARYSVVCDDGELFKNMNQQNNGGQWNLLGTYRMTAGTNAAVRLYNIAASNYVMADAVLFAPAFAPVSDLPLARYLPDGTEVALPNAVVSAVFNGEFYVQNANRTAGIKVKGSGVTEGSTVQIGGTLSTINGERVIMNPVTR